MQLSWQPEAICSKALSMTQPWAQLVVEAHKRYETRSWPLPQNIVPYTTIGIHAAKGFPGWAKRLMDEGTPFSDALNREIEELPVGALIGLVDVVESMPAESIRHRITDRELVFGDYGAGRYAWQLASPRRFPYPIPCRGALGLWRLPDFVLAQIAEWQEQGLLCS